jgi:hypothetical protein
VRIVEPPRDGIEHASDTVLRHAPAEERVALECAERVVLNFGMRWGRALPDKVEVYVGAQWGRVE